MKQTALEIGKRTSYRRISSYAKTGPYPASHSQVGKSSTFLSFSSNSDQFFLFFLKLYLISSSFWPSGWATRSPGKTLATPLCQNYNFDLCPVPHAFAIMRHMTGETVLKFGFGRDNPLGILKVVPYIYQFLKKK